MESASRAASIGVNKQKRCTVTFRVAIDLPSEQHIRVVSSSEHFGADHEHGFVLSSEEPDGAEVRVWSGAIDLPTHTNMEYKYVVYQDSTPCFSLSAIRKLVTNKESHVQDDGQFRLQSHTLDSKHDHVHDLMLQLELPSSYTTKLGHPRLGISLRNREQVKSVKICVRDSASKIVGEALLRELHDETTFSSRRSDIKSLHFEVQAGSTSRAVVLVSQLSSAHHGFITAPLLDAEFLVLGEITFRYVVVTPFAHPRAAQTPAPVERMKIPCPRSSSSLLIGHRGTGAAGSRELVDGKVRSHIRENTVLSFTTAGAQGAQLVEFDVHLTSDLVPVIYHDFATHTQDTHSPIHSLSYEKFSELGRRAIAKTNSLEDLRQSTSAAPLPIHDNFPTLREVLKKVPRGIGFNVEIKYPIEDEVQRYDLHPVNRNTYLDCILWEIYEHAKDRFIVFSSFDPEICSMLVKKQPHYPVFFLTQLGTELRSDPRSNSVDASIHFATSTGLGGLVCPARHLIQNPDVVKTIKDSGLRVWTWGRDNNEPSHVLSQQQMGVDGIIADHIAHVAKHWPAKN